MRLIDADALTKEIKQDIADNGLTERYVFYRINEAPTIDTKQIKYFDEDEKVWKIGNVIMEQKNEPQVEIPEYAEWKEPFEKMTDCPWK